MYKFYTIRLCILGVLYEKISPLPASSNGVANARFFDLTEHTRNNFVVDCLQKLISNNFGTNPFVTIMTEDGNSSMQEIQKETLRQMNLLSKYFLNVINNDIISVDQEKFKFVENLVMFTCNYENFESKSRLYEKINSHTNYIIYISAITNYEEVAAKILMKLWSYNIYKSLVLVGKNKTVLCLYGLEIYTESNVCGSKPKFSLLGVYKKGATNDKWSFLQNRIPIKFKCSLRLVSVKIPPYVIDESSGFEMEIVKEISAKTGIKFSVILKEDDGPWGERQENGLWPGRLGYVYNNSYLAIGSIPSKQDIWEDFELSVSYFQEHMIWLVPNAGNVPKWKSVIVIFSFSLWIACFCVLILGAVCLTLVSLLDNEIVTFKCFRNNVLNSLGILIGNSLKKHPFSNPTRIIFLCLSIYSIIICSVYESSLINFLTKPLMERPISSISEMEESGIGFGGMDVLLSVFETLHKKIYKLYQTDPNNNLPYYWMKKVANERNICTPVGRFYTKYLISQKNRAICDEYGRSKVHLMNEVINVYGISMVMPKGFPLYTLFNSIIKKMISGGILMKYLKQYDEAVKRAESLKFVFHAPLTLNDLQGAFILLLFGCLFGTTFLIVEVIFEKTNKKYRF